MRSVNKMQVSRLRNESVKLRRGEKRHHESWDIRNKAGIHEILEGQSQVEVTDKKRMKGRCEDRKTELLQEKKLFRRAN